jgi:CheY-like chemotaxis protein/two-component sensor histidine kinase
VDDLLDVSRLLRGRVELRRERLDLGRLVQNFADDYRPAVEQAGLDLAVRVPATPVWVVADATRVRQILENLLSNAMKFTDAGGRVEVTAEREGAQAVVRVSDTGVGIEAGQLPRLFQPLSQADQSLHRTKGGLGLGLALVRGMAELHGGTAEAHSDGAGRGAEFTVRLPAEQEPAALAETDTAPAPAPRRLRVLVIEDHRDAAESLRMLLELRGHDVRVAYSGPEGVKMAKEWRPDVALCDIGLPGLDGYGVAIELRSSPETAHTRLIAITGYGQAEARQRCLDVGFEAHLTKPAEPQALLDLLDGQRPGA